jgi:DNA repair photolyase
MAITEIHAKSILRKHKKIDSWFVSRYGMNLYRGCTHNCVYCDGRAEGYYVDGEFGKDLQIKVNAIDILKRELNPARKRNPFGSGFIFMGGGVTDAYQAVEDKYKITRQALGIVEEFNHPVHVLTKSTMVERDMDILRRINENRKAIVSMSFSSVDEFLSSIFEPGVTSPEERIKVLRKFKSNGITCGMYLLPIIPFITDTPDMIERSISAAKEANLDFVVFGGMTLKDGRQKDHFYKTLTEYFPDLLAEYDMAYPKNKWGGSSAEYHNSLHNTLYEIAKYYKMPVRMPYNIYKDILTENDFVVVILEQIDYLLKLRGQRSNYGYAAYKISRITEPLSAIRNTIKNINGIGKITGALIFEIIDTGRSEMYEKLLYNLPAGKNSQ